jgi:ankyrin repeat protein
MRLLLIIDQITEADTGLIGDLKEINQKIIELLLNHPDVDVNRLDNAGRNALDYAMNNAHGHGERIANLLKKKSVVERENQPDAKVIMGVNPTINVPHQIQLAQLTDVFELLLNSEAVGVGYCDIRERFFYPTNVCPVNSYSVLLHPSLPNKKNE